jgi:hypothetical protein
MSTLCPHLKLAIRIILVQWQCNILYLLLLRGFKKLQQNNKKITNLKSDQ